MAGSSRRRQHHRRKEAWKKVNVQLGDDDEEIDQNNNHYDDPKLAPCASHELDAMPGEQVGIFYGLEVMDGSQYRVERGMTKFLVIKDEKNAASNDETTESSDGVEKRELVASTESKKKRKKNNKKKKKRKLSDDACDSEEAAGEKRTSAMSGRSLGDTAGPDKTAAWKESRIPQPESKKQKTNKKQKLSEKSESFEHVTDMAAHQPADTSWKKSTSKTHTKPNERAPPIKDDNGQEQKALEVDDNSEQQQHIQSMQLSWMTASGGVSLHPTLCRALIQQQFWTPTPIQAATLSAAIFGRRNVVGAAPTGSGKSLAFLLPMCQFLLEQEEEDDVSRALQALILTPTRELALQIQAQANLLLPGRTGTIVGGLAHAKQYRVLKQRPSILVATPGRLWELLSSRQHEHLNDLSQLRFLVIDEADRMVQQGSFKELSRILDAIQQANPMNDDDSDEAQDLHEEDMEEPDRLFALPGVPGEAKLEMLSPDILEQLERQRTGEDAAQAKPVVAAMNKEELENLDEGKDGNEGDSEAQSDAEISLPPPPPVHRQTFVYSATLTLPASAAYVRAKKNKRFQVDVDGSIAEILEKSRAKGKTKVVDLTNADKSGKSKHGGNVMIGNGGLVASVGQFRLPPGLSLCQIKCTQRHKDSHLYAYLMTTEQGSSGPCLVFCNSISAVRRVGATLETLGMKVRILHANMQQRARLKAVESLRDSTERTVVVATDVAARGLNIPSVATVCHYDVARSVDTFVHRSGRTARGVGEAAVGVSLSLIAPGEDKSHSSIVQALEVDFDDVAMDSSLLSSAQERVNLASKIVETSEIEQKTHKNNLWFKEKAEEAGIEMDEDMLDEGLAGGDKRDQSRLREAQKAKSRLRQLLAEPMQTQRYGKFLSTNTAARQKTTIPTAVLPSGGQQSNKKKRRTWTSATET